VKIVLLGVGSVLLLGACSSAPVLSTSINGYRYAPAPTSLDDPRLSSPRFYMDDDKSPVTQHYPYQ
jgi:hypothetical protein